MPGIRSTNLRIGKNQTSLKVDPQDHSTAFAPSQIRRSSFASTCFLEARKTQWAWNLCAEPDRNRAGQSKAPATSVQSCGGSGMMQTRGSLSLCRNTLYRISCGWSKCVCRIAPNHAAALNPYGQETDIRRGDARNPRSLTQGSWSYEAEFLARFCSQTTYRFVI